MPPGWFSESAPDLLKRSNSWTTGQQLHGHWWWQWEMAARLLRHQLVWWRTWTSSQTTWQRNQLQSKSDLELMMIPKEKENRALVETKGQKEKRANHTVHLHMVNLIEAIRTMAHRGISPPTGSDTPTSPTRPLRTMTLGHGTSSPRNRDSTGPQVPNNILRYPTITTVRMILSFCLMFRSRGIVSLCYRFSTALEQVWRHCGTSLVNHS